MALDIKTQVEELQRMYRENPRSGNFTALVLGESGSGKSYLIRTARLPIHIDVFDPGGTTNLDDMIASGQIVVDTRWINENPSKPSVFAEWEKVTEQRFQDGYFNSFATVMIDSSTTFSQTVMNQILKAANRAGQAPQWAHDYVPQKVKLTNWITRFMTEPINCDFFLTGHLDANKDEVSGRISYRYMATGKASVSIPLLFDEIWVMDPKEVSKGGVKDTEYRVLTRSTGTHLARSRMSKNGLLEQYEKPNIKNILRKCKRSVEDKPLFN